MACQSCGGTLDEVSLRQALELTQSTALGKSIKGKSQQGLTDSYKQYHIRSYLKNRSCFLDFDLYKNRLIHGRRLKRFFIAPVRISAIVNIPWLLFNIISSNKFHLEYTEYCPRCECKYIRGAHTKEECEYNVEYFNILNDILSGQIVQRKIIYEEYARWRMRNGLRSAYRDLFRRRIPWEIFWDFLSVSSSVLFWLYLIVFICLPWVQAFMTDAQQIQEVSTRLYLR